MNETTVVNLRDEEFDVRIGRPGIFGNPFPEWKYGREACIRMYRTYFYDKLEWSPEFKDAVLTLRGKRLGCFCKPLACHGDVIKEYLDNIPERVGKE